MLLLYMRMFLTMAVTLYTSRIVLNVLGIEDFGIYNVVGGVVSTFGFMNAAMTTATQRYLIFEFGRNNFNQLQKIFNTSLSIHALISILVIVLAETVGLWLLSNKLTIPSYRMDAALWVFQLSVFSSVVMIMSVPYNAAIIAHEKMSAFAYISVLEVVLKLLIVFLLQVGDYDRLKMYAILIFAIQLCIRLIYGLYCDRYFPETKFRKMWDPKLFREMLSFASWYLWANCATIASTQGVNILLNLFFNPVTNAARGIAVQVQGAFEQFSISFQMALNPQITKSYAVHDYSYMHNLIFRSSKFSFFLLFLLLLPVMFETEMILTVWLKIVPADTVIFVRLMLCATIVDTASNPLMVAAAATGKVRFYQLAMGGTLLAILPISYIVLKLGGNPSSVFVVHLCIFLLAFVVRLFIVCPMIELSLTKYVKQVVLRCLLVAVISLILPLLLRFLFPEESIGHFLLVCLSCVVSVFVSVYYWGLDSSERLFVDRNVISLISKIGR